MVGADQQSAGALDRVVVDAGDGSYVFELDWGNAKHAAEQITTITGRVA